MILKHKQKNYRNFVYFSNPPLTGVESDRKTPEKTQDRNELFGNSHAEEHGNSLIEKRSAELRVLREKVGPNSSEQNLATPHGIQGELELLFSQSQQLQKDGVAITKEVESFGQGLIAFEKGKKEWSVFLRGSPFADDEDTDQIRAKFIHLKEEAAAKLKALREKQRAIAEYGKSLQQAAIDLREEKTKERDSKLALLQTKGETLDLKQKKDEKLYLLLSDQQEYLAVNPSINSLGASIQALESAKLKAGTESERITAEYGELLPFLDRLVSDSASVVTDMNGKNEALIAAVDSSVHTLDSVEIDRPNFWDATGSLVLGKIGEGWSLLTKDVISQGILDPASRWIKESTKNIPVVNVLASVGTNVLLDLPSGLIEGGGELIAGITTMVAHPIETGKGLGALIGRDPRSGEWKLATVGNSWKAMGSALIAYDHFEKGEIGKGIGKVALNVVLTATGAGAALKGVEGASIAYRLAQAAGASTLRAGTRAAGTGARIFVTEFSGGLTKLPGETVKTVGKLLKAPANFVSTAKEFIQLSPIQRLKKTVAATNSELATVSQKIGDFMLGGKKVSELGEVASLTPEALMQLNPTELAKLGIKGTEAIAELMHLKDLLAHKQHLASARSTLTQELSSEKVSNKKQVIDNLTQGLRPEERALFETAYVDKMTGLLNRGGLNFLKKMIQDRKRVSIASFDGDHFKAVNDVCGTKFGDAMITEMGDHFHEVVQSLRKQGYDVHAVRMGGEEFVLFGEVPKEVLARAVEEMSAALKQSLREQFLPAQMDAMALNIFSEKYSREANGLAKAYREIGGSTTGVGEFQFGEKVKADLATRRTLQLVDDELLTVGKNKTGRGKVYMDFDDLKTASKKAEAYKAHNSLTVDQNNAMEKIADELSGKVDAQFNQLTPKKESILNGFESGSQNRKLLEDFFETPPIAMEKAEAISRATGIAVGDLRQAKLECVHATNDFGMYTGAATMRKLESLGTEFTSAHRIELGEFKSINETMGHTHGDTFLTWAYQEVILPTAREVGLSSNDIIVAQKGANFYYRIRESALALQGKFEQALQTNLPQLFDTIDVGAPTHYRDIRVDWIKHNKAKTLQQSIAKADSLTFPAYAN